MRMQDRSLFSLRKEDLRPAAHMVPRGLEPRTLRLLAVRSNQLSYETTCGMASSRSSISINRIKKPINIFIIIFINFPLSKSVLFLIPFNFILKINGEDLETSLCDAAFLIKNRPARADWFIIGDWNINQLVSPQPAGAVHDTVARRRRNCLTAFVDAFQAQVVIPQAIQHGRVGPWIEATSFCC